MKKGIDTHFLAARQLILWGEKGSDLEKVVNAALALPKYVVRTSTVLAEVSGFLARSKIEVVIVDLQKAETIGELAQVRAVDPDVELIVIADRTRADEFVAAGLSESFDLLGRPFSAPELLRRVELARERRYLRRAEQRQKRTEARTGAIVQAVPTGIISIDVDGVVHDWNHSASRIFGWGEAEALGRVFWELIGIDVAAIKDEEGRLQLGRKFELSVRNRAGTIFPIDMSLVAVPLAERTMMCAIVEDRTLAKRLEMELRQAQKLEAIGQLSAGLAHEINTPCQFMGDNIGYLEGAVRDLVALLKRYAELVAASEKAGFAPELLAKVRAEEEIADLAFAIERMPVALCRVADGIRRVAEIVRAMKSFARTDWSKGTSVDLNELIDNVLTVVGHQLHAVAEVECRLQPVPPVLAHGGDLHQAIFHIVRNAIDAVAARHPAAGGKGTIKVESRTESDGIALAISDTGCGIPARIQGRVFEPFFTTKEVGRGTGQGLSVAWSVIVEQHGGRLSFESVEGQGTTFYVRLPLAR
jgi:two-component system, NtrC family, sensor kinase